MSGKGKGLVAIFAGPNKIIVPISATVRIEVDLNPLANVCVKTTTSSSDKGNPVVNETWCLFGELFDYLWQRVEANQKIKDEAAASLEL